MRNTLNKIYIIILCLLCTYLLQAQEFSVKSFYQAERDLTANTPGSMVLDQSGNVCALIKVETTLDGYTFDVGVLGVTEVKRVGGELWVYVPHSIRKITISHPQLGVIRDYVFNINIDKARTYVLKLNAALGNRVYDSSKKQKMVLQVFPPNAKVEINGISMPIDVNGVCEQELSFGVYDMIVSAPKYHSQISQIEINDLSSVQKFNVHLKQAFGWLQIEGIGDEKLYIEEEEYLFTPNKNIELKSGHYRLLMKKPLHKPYETTVEIKDSVINKITPSFVENYKELELKVDSDADIYIDNVKVATGIWRGKLEYGKYRVECRKISHRSSCVDINVIPNMHESIVLDNPQPIYGSLAMSSNPTGSKLFINGEYVGMTPMYIPNLLIGEYKVTVEAPDKKKQTHVARINENEELTVSFDLTSNNISSNKKYGVTDSNKKQYVKFHVTPADATLEIAGKLQTTNNGIYEELMPFGKYYYKSNHDIYHQSEGIVEVNNASEIHSVIVNLKPAFGYLTVSKEAQPEIHGANVYVDDLYVGSLPFTHKIILSGTHYIRITKDNYRSFNANYTFYDGEEIKLSPTLVPIMGSLTISTKPSNAKVYIDNKYVGHSTKRINELIIGKHSVSVNLDGYYTQEKEVFVKENRDTSISFSLRKIPLTPREYNKKYRNWGVVNSVEFNYGFPIHPSAIVYKNLGVRNYKCLHPMEFTYSIGYRFNNWVSVSLGSGITHELVDLRNKGDVFADYYYENNIKEIVNYSPNIVPLYANSKLYLARTKYQPMISVSTGAYIVPKVKGLLLLDFGAGVNYRINRILNCYAMFSVGTAPTLKGSVDVHSNEINAIRRVAWTPRLKIGITL